MKAAAQSRRARSNDGHHSRMTRALPIRPELLAKLIAEFHEARPERVHRVYHGPKAATGSPAVRLTDERVLQIRRMRDHHGMTTKQICEATGESENCVTSVVMYRNRVHLDPGPRPIPVDAKAA